MDGPSKPATETELKLIFPPGAERVLAGHPAFRSRGAAPKRRRIVTTYFDTSGEALKARGFSLRVRRVDSTRVQTLKSEGDGALAVQRGEWEWRIKGDRPDLSLLQQTPVVDRLPRLTAGELQPVVVTDVVRTTRRIRLDGQTVVEAAFDRGAILADDAKAPICELELELREGEAGPLYTLAFELHRTTPLTLGVESKAARGYRLRTGAAPQPKVAVAPALDPDVDGAAAFRQIVIEELGCLIANQPAARAGDAEGVHQMRVGIRRLRSTLTFFAPYLEKKTARGFQTELRRVARICGEARDWDVFCLEVLPRALDRAENIGWIDLLRPAAQGRREKAHDELVRCLDEPGFTALALDLAARAEGASTGERRIDDERLRRPLARLAPKLLDRLQRKVERRAARLEKLSQKRLHALRKSLKVLSFGIECLARLYSRKAVRLYAKRCKSLQRSLGALNDAATAVGLAEQLSENGREDLAAAASALSENLAKARRRAMKNVRKKWRALDDERPFWRQGRRSEARGGVNASSQH